MSCCPTCGSSIHNVVKRGPLLVQEEPYKAFWHGLPIKHLTSVQAKILKAIADGRGSHGWLEMTCAGENTTSEVIKTQISWIRPKLPKGLSIKNIPGWGYELELED